MIERILTIGAYGFDAQTFVERLNTAGVDLFLDIRARRGMRGAAYSFANAVRLQAALAAADIRYAHVKDLAPTAEAREAQQLADAERGVSKRVRETLSDVFVARYEKSCLAAFEAKHFVELWCNGARRPVLFCVERAPSACHRSLVAQRIGHDLSVHVEHLMP